MPQGKLNIYTCERCHSYILTKDIDEGVTPFLTQCKVTPHCSGMMQSSMYRVFNPDMAHDYEWYKPPTTTGLSVSEREHVSKGGLLLRRVDPPRLTPYEVRDTAALLIEKAINKGQALDAVRQMKVT